MQVDSSNTMQTHAVNYHADSQQDSCKLTAHVLLFAKWKMLVTEEGARTLDHKVKSLALYQLSYSGPYLRISSLGCPRLIWVRVTG